MRNRSSEMQMAECGMQIEKKSKIRNPNSEIERLVLLPSGFSAKRRLFLLALLDDLVKSKIC
jgi:hypothetical protein